MIRERLQKMRALMKERKMDYYLVPSDDFHASEYVGEYFKCREWLSGFTGSAGTLVIGQEMAGLWTDGRYFLQAQEQLEGSGITLYKMGQKDVPDVTGFLADALKEGGMLGFDGRVVSKAFTDKLKERIRKNSPQALMKIVFAYEEDLIDLIWNDRPPLSCSPVTELSVFYAGQERAQKLSKVREHLTQKKAAYFALTSLDDIAWLLNIRGGDVAYNPVVRAYFLMGQKDAFLYAEESAFPEELKKRLADDGVLLKPYDQIYGDLRELADDAVLLWDEKTINYALFRCCNQQVKTVSAENPTLLLKAVKNPTEVENIRVAHLKDAVAVTRFLYWLKQAVPKGGVTEISAADKLEEFRSLQENYRGQSFAPIVGYAEHGAIVHYSATPESDVELKPENFVLIDTGGQYLEGTTDITRTVALGTLTEEQKRHYTAVLQGNLNLAATKFPAEYTGLNLDGIARRPIWQQGLDYNHGTGHGVGYYLNVHEGPNGIRSRAAGNMSSQRFEEGMVTSDEPGVYLEGRYGIRLENLILTKKAEEMNGIQFLCFEPLTVVPFDLNAVEPSMLSEAEKQELNAYHQKVFEMVSPYLDEEEIAWLRQETRPI